MCAFKRHCVQKPPKLHIHWWKYNSVECCHHRWPNKCLGRDVIQSATYCKDGAGENKPKQVSHSCLFRPLVKCQTPPRLEKEEGTCQSSWRPIYLWVWLLEHHDWIFVCTDKSTVQAQTTPSGEPSNLDMSWNKIYQRVSSQKDIRPFEKSENEPLHSYS